MTLLEAAPTNTAGSAAKAWLRALELTAPIPRNRERVLSTVIAERAEEWRDKPAVLSDRECFTYRQLAEQANRYGRWALSQKLSKGDVVCLLMTNRPEYLAAWLGLTSVGVVVSLLNTNLTGPALGHCINVVAPKQIIVASELLDSLQCALPHLETEPTVWVENRGPQRKVFAAGLDSTQKTALPSLNAALALQSGEPLTAAERPQLTIEDLALYIYTSGTTGMPKAAKVSHARVMQWSHWFAGIMNTQPSDRMYSCLPMYHSVGGVQVPGATLVSGGSLILREKFSASQFWSDIVRWECTIFQYIGELCRYLLHTPPSDSETRHQIRLACGNGLAPEIWDEFKERFHIPQILEFYASTEGGVSLFNVEGKTGAIGHIPAYLAHRFSPPLVRFDVERDEPARNDQGLCIRCGPNEVGEAIGKILDDPASIGSRFEGYTSVEASEKKVLRNVFQPGDAYVRTGDLMRKDEKGFFYFVDRIGDTFRWKGENVATSEVAEAFCAFPGINHANVYGVTVPSTEGRAGMASVVSSENIDLAELREHLIRRLPPYARPLFLRLRGKVDLTGTYKYSKTELIRDGYDPQAVREPLYFNCAESKSFIPLDDKLHRRIQAGEIRF